MEVRVEVVGGYSIHLIDHFAEIVVVVVIGVCYIGNVGVVWVDVIRIEGDGL